MEHFLRGPKKAFIDEKFRHTYSERLWESINKGKTMNKDAIREDNQRNYSRIPSLQLSHVPGWVEGHVLEDPTG